MKADDVNQAISAVVSTAIGDDMLIAEAMRFSIRALDGQDMSCLDLERAWCDHRSVPTVASELVVTSDTDLPNQPAVAAARNRASALVAMREAIVRLLYNGTIVPVEDQQLFVIKVTIAGGLTHQNHPGSKVIGHGIATPKTGDRYRLRQSPVSSSLGTALDPDIFLADLVSLNLSSEAAQCTREAFLALRTGLYLGCMALIGMLGEVQLFVEAERLRGMSSHLDSALNASPTQALSVQIRLFDFLKKGRGLTNRATAAQAHAEHLRNLRNYGVHLKPKSANPLAHQVAEVPCATLLLQTHAYLLNLHELVSQRLTQIP